MISDPAGSLWEASSRENPGADSLSGDLDVDLLIIGGGFTGLSAALEAANSGASVALLEAHSIGHGGSGRNVGLANAGLWLPPEDIIAQVGEDAGRRLITILGEAPARVFSLIEQHHIDCEATRNGTLHCAHSPRGLRELEKRLRQGNQFGAPLSLLDAEEARRRTGSGKFHGALFDPRAGTIQPLAYCRGLARAARDEGAQIFHHSPVTSVSRADGRWVVTALGYSVRSKALLVATNAYHLGLEEPFKPQFVPVSYSQFATVPLPSDLRGEILASQEGCWDTALVMSSFRLDKAGRLIFGGMGNIDGPGRAIHGAWARRKLRSLFPQLAGIEIEHAWQGTIAMTSDHIPKILEFGPNSYACFGYSGRGIGPGTVFGAETARALLTGTSENLPVAPVRHHVERFSTLRAAYYEMGATLTHAISPAPLLG